MSTIDPQQALSFSIAANPGVYALLLGSGVSKSAGVPTGWDIVLDLIRQLATSEGRSAEPDPAVWYRQRYNGEPIYSELLDAVAKTPAERQQLLRPYFEPNESERQEGIKQPTTAHRAIAQLVAQGFVRIIVTTNFDRLIENALNDAGITPTVLSSPDQVAGALPLIHTRCCVLKVHGDYLDPRILNSPSELSDYNPEIDRLLDQIFDQFGLIVSGWSADWDVALRRAITRAPSRRFTTYWASFGEPTELASTLMQHRDAQLIRIDGADAFFRSIQDAVASITEFARPHPLSTQMAVTTLKRYLTNAEDRIRLSDYVDNATTQLLTAISSEAFQSEEPLDPDAFTARVRAYESACSTLLAMATVAGYWSDETQFQDWTRAISRLYAMPYGGRNSVWLALHKYPALLLLYALGLGLVESGRIDLLVRMFQTRVYRHTIDSEPSYLLPALVDDTTELRVHNLFKGMESRHRPLSDWLLSVFENPFNQFVITGQQYTYTFDKLEVLMALGFAQLAGNFGPNYRVPLGAFLYRSGNRHRILEEISDSIRTFQHESPFVASGILGNGSYQWRLFLETFQKYVERAALQAGIV